VKRKIFEPKTEEVREDWRKLLNEDFHDFHTSPLLIKVTESQEIEMGGASSTLGSRGKI
jgi:hypothetical protein